MGWKANQWHVQAIAPRFGATPTHRHHGDERDLSAADAFGRHLDASLSLADNRAGTYGANTRTFWFTMHFMP